MTMRLFFFNFFFVRKRRKGDAGIAVENECDISNFLITPRGANDLRVASLRISLVLTRISPFFSYPSYVLPVTRRRFHSLLQSALPSNSSAISHQAAIREPLLYLLLRYRWTLSLDTYNTKVGRELHVKTGEKDTLALQYPPRNLMYFFYPSRKDEKKKKFHEIVDFRRLQFTCILGEFFFFLIELKLTKIFFNGSLAETTRGLRAGVLENNSRRGWRYRTEDKLIFFRPSTHLLVKFTLGQLVVCAF